MELASQLAHIMFKVGIVFSLVSAGWDDVLASDSPFNERDTWKPKSKVMELKCTNL